MDIAACGMIQLLRTCATNRASHGPNSTPLCRTGSIRRSSDPGRRAGCRSSPAARTSARSGWRRRSRRRPARAAPPAARSSAARSRRRSGERQRRRRLGGCGCGCGRARRRRPARRRPASIRSGELPRENGIGLVGLRRTLDGPRLAIEVGQAPRAAAAWAPAYRAAAARTRIAPVRARSCCCSSSARCCSSSACCRCSMISLHERQPRPEQDRDQQPAVKIDVNQHHFATRQRPRDPRRVRTIVLEVEVHQGFSDYNSSRFGVHRVHLVQWGSGFRSPAN